MAYAVGTFASRAAILVRQCHRPCRPGGQAKALKIAADALEVSEDDLVIDGVIGVKGLPEASMPIGTTAVLSNPLRYAFDEAAKAATRIRRHLRSGQAAGGRRRAGLEGKDFYSPTQATFANGMHAAIVETDPVTAEIKILRYWRSMTAAR